ncbi:unnamed protein product [Gordionus sp. m RMFG-2023]
MEMVGYESTNMFGSVNTNMGMVGDESTNMSGSVNTNMEMLDFGASGIFKSKGKSLRNTKSFRQNCTSNFVVKLIKRGTNQLVVTRFHDTHNHELDSNLYKRLFKQQEFCMATEGQQIVVDQNQCNCGLTKSLLLPCMHIFFYRKKNDINIFTPNLVMKDDSNQNSEGAILDNLSLLNSIKMPPLKMGYLKQMDIKKGKTCGNVKITIHISNGISEPDHNSNYLLSFEYFYLGKENKVNKNPFTSLPKNNRIAVS